MCSQPSRSEAFLKLNTEQKKRYLCKLSLIEGIDPYCLKNADFNEDTSVLPPLRYIFANEFYHEN